jgi:hypothetical protein
MHKGYTAKFLRVTALWLPLLGVLPACRDVDTLAPSPRPNLAVATSASTAIPVSVVDASRLDTIPDRRASGEQVRWGVNAFPITQQPYTDGASFPYARQLGLTRELGMRHVRIPIPTFANGVPQAYGADMTQQLQGWLAAAADSGVTTLPVLLDTFFENEATSEAPADILAGAYGTMQAFLSTWGGHFPTVQMTNEYDVQVANYGGVASCSNGNIVCQRALAKVNGGLLAAAAAGKPAVVGGAKDLLWWLNALNTLPSYASLPTAAWHFYADQNGYAKPSTPGYLNLRTTKEVMDRSYKPNIFYTELGRDPVAGDDVTDYNTNEDFATSRALGEMMRDVHGSPYDASSPHPVKAAYIFELVDRYQDGTQAQRVRGLYRCLWQRRGAGNGCEFPSRKPGADTVRFWVRAFSDSGRAAMVNAAVRLAGRGWGSTGESDIDARMVSLGNGRAQQRAGMWQWLINDDSVRALFAISAYPRILSRNLDMNDPGNQAAIAYWTGCMRGSSSCFDGAKRSREWVLAEIAGSDEFWNISGSNVNGFVRRLVGVALRGRGAAGDSAAMVTELRNDYNSHGQRWRTTQRAFVDMRYRRAEVRTMFIDAGVGGLPTTTELNNASAKLAGETILNSVFQERTLLDLMRNRTLLRNAVLGTFPPEYARATPK